MLVLLSCGTLGIPGAVIYELSRPFIWMVHGEAVSSNELGDSAWPLALYISFLWPWGILPGYLLAWRVLEIDTVLRWLVLLGVTGLWTIGVAVALYSFVEPPA